MRGNKLHMNFAHIPGPCGIAVAPDGSFALSSGVDCNIRLHDIRTGPPEPWWISSPGNEPDPPDLEASDLHDKPINAIALTPDATTFATASDDGFVRLFTTTVKLGSNEQQPSESPTLDVYSELLQACARFGGPVRAVDFSPTGAFLAAAGEEPGVLKIIMTAQPSNVNVLRASSHGPGFSPIVALAFDPKTDFVASVGRDGSACVWNVESGTCTTALSINDRRARCITWSPQGDLLAVGTDDGTVLVSREEWTFNKRLEDEHEIEDDEDSFEGPLSLISKKSKGVTAVAWSQNGLFLLVARDDATVRLWDVEKRKIYACWNAEEPVQAMRWHPSSNAFMVLDRIGQWAMTSDVVPAHMPAPFRADSQVKLPEMPNVPSRYGDSRPKTRRANGTDANDIAGYDEVGQIRKTKGKSSHGRSDEDDSSSGEDEHDMGSIIGSCDDENSRSPRPEINFDPDDVDADEEEDAVQLRRHRELAIQLSDARLERERARCLDESDNEFEGANTERHRRERRGRHRVDKKTIDEILAMLPRPQEPFMPSATPLKAKETRKRRILCWNLTAAIISYDENTHDTVEIEFADAARRNIGVKDHFGFTMACMSETGVLLGSPGGKDHSGLVSFRPFASWSSNSEWTQFLAKDESAVAISLGRRHAAVAVTAPLNLVRLFSLSGIQTDVFGVPGSIITLASANDFLAVVYAASPNSAEMRFCLFEISSSGEQLRSLASENLVLSPNSSLEWFGFTNDTHDVVAYDSNGCIWINPVRNGVSRWLPMLTNAAKSADCEWFWLAAVTSEAAIGVPCLSNERYPPAKPRPALRTVHLLAPVIDPISKNGQSSISERYFRTRLKLARALAVRATAEETYDSDDEQLVEAEDAANLMEKETDKCILGLMELACRQEHNLRAFDCATRLKCPVSFKFAVGLANHYKRTALAGRVESLAQQRLASTTPTSPPPCAGNTTRFQSPAHPRRSMVNTDNAVVTAHDISCSDSWTNMKRSSNLSGGSNVISHSVGKKGLNYNQNGSAARKGGIDLLNGVSDDEEESGHGSVKKYPLSSFSGNSDDVTSDMETCEPTPLSQASVKGFAAGQGGTGAKKRASAPPANRFQKRAKT